MRVLVLGNRDDPETGFVGDALIARGAVLDPVWRDDVADPLPPVGDHDLVLVLGSEWSVYAETRADAVARESDYLRAAFSADVPVFGICYGGQILAHALGGTVEAAPDGGEVGWFTVDSDVPDSIPDGPYMQWHTDRFSLPPGAKELARSPVGPQAYVIGSALGLQFHPEVSPEIVARWAHGGKSALDAIGLDVGDLIGLSEQQAPDAERRAAAIVNAFLDGQLTGRSLN